MFSFNNVTTYVATTTPPPSANPGSANHDSYSIFILLVTTIDGILYEHKKFLMVDLMIDGGCKNVNQ